MIGVHEYRIWLCDLCITGAGGECHVPGCALFLNRAPDLPLKWADGSLITRMDDAQSGSDVGASGTTPR